MSDISVEVLRDSTCEERALILSSILHVQASVYPPTWLEEDSENYYRSALASNAAINIVVKDDGKLTGYLLAVPLHTVLADLVPYDPCIAISNPDAYYIDTFEALPRNGFGSSRKVIRALEAELRRRDISLLLCHARISTGLSKVLRHYFENRIVILRRIERWEWYGREEPTEFIEVQVFVKGVQ